MPPLASDGIGADPGTRVDGQSTTNASAENDAEHNTAIRARSLSCLRYRKTIGIISNFNGPTKPEF